MAPDARVRARRRRTGRRLHLLRQPERRGRWLALSRGGAVRSERGRDVGLLPPRDSPARAARPIGTGRQNTLDMLAACAEPGTAAHLCANLSVNGVGGWFLPSRDELIVMYRHLRATGVGRLRRPRRHRQLHLLGVVAADGRHGGAHRLRRPRPRRTSTTRTFRGGSARSGRSNLPAGGLPPPPITRFARGCGGQARSFPSFS